MAKGVQNNIFEGATFGNKFITKDGTIVRYLYQRSDIYPNNICSVYIYVPKCKYSVETMITYNNKGEMYIGNGEWGHDKLDIIFCYQEPSDEDEFDELACNFSHGDKFIRKMKKDIFEDIKFGNRFLVP